MRAGIAQSSISPLFATFMLGAAQTVAHATPQQEAAPAAQPPAAETPAAETPAAETPEEIFRRVFGGEPPPLAASDYPVLINGVNIGDYAMSPPTGDDPGSIDVQFVTRGLIPSLTDEMAARATELVRDKKRVSFEDIRTLGVSVEFDRAALALRIGLSNDLQAEQVLNLRRSARRVEGLELVRPSAFSAYATVQAGMTMVQDSRRGETGPTDQAVDLLLAANLHGLVAEARLSYDETRRNRFGRETVRLTYDDTSRLLRFEAADLTVRRAPMQGNAKISGLSVYRHYGIDPYRITRPIASQSFELTRAARVQIYLNGVYLREFNLQGGRYDLRDLPLVSSAGNDVELRITYTSGETEILRFPAFFDFELLDEGLTDFSVSAGVPYVDDNGLRRYDTSTYTGSAFVRHGLTKELTVGLNWQGNRELDLVGTDISWASPVGTFRLQAATDARDPGKHTSQVNLAYRWRGTDRQFDRSFDLSALSTGRDFRVIDTAFFGNVAALQLRARYGQNLNERSRIQIYGGYDKNRAPYRNAYYAGGTYTRQLAIGTLSLSSEYQRNEEGRNIVGRAALTIPLGRTTVTATYASDDHAARLQYSRTADQGTGGLGLVAGIDRRSGGNSVFGGATYFGNRFEANIEQTVAGYFGNGDQRDARLRASLGSSVVLAGGHVGLGRPVFNSFGLFARNKGAGDYTLAVEPQSGFGGTNVRYNAFSGPLGPAVLPDLAPYFVRGVQVDVPDAPAGTAIGGTVFNLRPSYRSGTLVLVGSERNASAIGKLVDSAGMPIGFASGEAHDLTEPGKYDPVPVFTNAAGRFFLEKLIPGHRYEVVLSGRYSPARFIVEIPADVQGMHRIETPISISRRNSGSSQEQQP